MSALHIDNSGSLLGVRLSWGVHWLARRHLLHAGLRRVRLLGVWLLLLVDWLANEGRALGNTFVGLTFVHLFL